MKTNERKCHSCGGYGTILFNGILKECKACNGKGKVKMKFTGIPSINELIRNPAFFLQSHEPDPN